MRLRSVLNNVELRIMDRRRGPPEIIVDPTTRIEQRYRHRFPIIGFCLFVISAVVTLAVVWTRHEGELSVGLFKFISALESLLPKAASTESVPSQRQFGPVYAALAIQPLPPSIERQSKIQNRLDQLSREPCYTEAAVALGTALIEAGYPREAATSMQTFAGKCGKHENVLPVAYDALQKVGDSAGSLQVANRLVEAVPTSGTVRYWRAMAYEELGQFPNALSDYLSTIQLSGNPRYVSGDVFYRLSRVYAALGRPCDAIIPLETYASFDAVNRRTTQTASLIAEYAQAGHCAANFANGTARVAFTGGTPEVRTLSVNVNGVVGTFLLDTGATFVTMTTRFAGRAKITAEPGNQISLQAAGSVVMADVARANAVSVGNAKASNVMVAIHKGTNDPFGQRIDGLLGMSFLARFNLSITANAVEFKAISLR